MKIIIIPLFSAISLILPQESIRDIKTVCTGISGKTVNSSFHQDIKQFGDLVYTLNMDILGLHNIKGVYDTDLKRADYAETDDYKAKYSKLAGQKAVMDSAIYCLDLDPDFQGERSLPFRYDKATGTFSITNEVGFSSYFNEPGNIQLDQILFKCPEGMSVSNKNINYACVDMVQETISFSVSNEALAREIEQNRDDVRLLFHFRLKGTVPIHGISSPMLNAGDYCLTTLLLKAVVYNSRTNKIWITYP